MSEPWMKWPEEEREAIADEYQHGAVFRYLAEKYHRHAGYIRGFLQSRGLLREKKRGVPSERAMDFIEVLCALRHKTDLPTAEFIDKVMDYYHIKAQRPGEYQRLLGKRESMRRRKIMRLAQGMCIRCGQRRIVPGHKFCAVCLARARQYQHKRRTWFPEVAGE